MSNYIYYNRQYHIVFVLHALIQLCVNPIVDMDVHVMYYKNGSTDEWTKARVWATVKTGEYRWHTAKICLNESFVIVSTDCSKVLTDEHVIKK